MSARIGTPETALSCRKARHRSRKASAELLDSMSTIADGATWRSVWISSRPPTRREGSGLTSVVFASARNPCRRGLHSYKPPAQESTCGMRNNEKFAEALRFFIQGATHALRSCHTSEAFGFCEPRAAGLTASLHAIGCAG
jgi:hypothetical protein